MDDLKYWLGFSLIPHIGSKRLLHLHQTFGNLADAWQASAHELAAAGLGEQAVSTLCIQRSQIDLNIEWAKVEKSGAWLLPYADERYPPLLKELDDAPALLYVRGRLTPDDLLALSVVGTRKATKYGCDVAYELSRKLVQQRITIVSGLAQGIDSAAHRGALDGAGRTIAVMGCGVDVVYPREHAQLMQRILANGAIISEFPIGTQPIAANFPRRNRILSGLALGVLVVEAPDHSGALITAALAAEQGREVFAVPGNIFNPMGRGSNRLIQQGAKLVIDAEDILEELNVAHDNRQTRVRTEYIAPSNDAEAGLLEVLEADPIHVDDLARICGLPIAEVTSTLTILELKGLAQMVGHMQYCRVYK